jgi:DNA adenine methylase
MPSSKQKRNHLSLVPPSPARCRPLLKWVGGKRWFVDLNGDDVYATVIDRGGRYFEPFLGGAAMALHLGLPNMVLSDIEQDLITTYRVIQDRPGELITMLGLLSRCGTDEKSYYSMREKQPTAGLDIAARMIYLNKLCYNGLHRKNKRGEFNVPYGKEKRTMPSSVRILEVSRALAGAELHCGSYQSTIRLAGPGDFIYADPPYHETFVDYSAHGFDDGEQRALAHVLQTAHDRGAEIVAHNSDTPLIRELYGDWAEIIEMPERRMVNSDGEGRGKVPCVLIVSAP